VPSGPLDGCIEAPCLCTYLYSCRGAASQALRAPHDGVSISWPYGDGTGAAYRVPANIAERYDAYWPSAAWRESQL